MEPNAISHMTLQIALLPSLGQMHGMLDHIKESGPWCKDQGQVECIDALQKVLSSSLKTWPGPLGSYARLRLRLETFHPLSGSAPVTNVDGHLLTIQEILERNDPNESSPVELAGSGWVEDPFVHDLVLPPSSLVVRPKVRLDAEDTAAIRAALEQARTAIAKMELDHETVGGLVPNFDQLFDLFETEFELVRAAAIKVKSAAELVGPPPYGNVWLPEHRPSDRLPMQSHLDIMGNEIKLHRSRDLQRCKTISNSVGTNVEERKSILAEAESQAIGLGLVL